MGLRSKETENPVLFKRAEILGNLDHRFVSVKGHYQADLPQQRLPKEEAGGVEMLLLNGNVLDAFAQFIDSSDSDLCTSLISSSFPSEGQGKRLALGLA